MTISIGEPLGKRLAESTRLAVNGLPGLGSYTLVIGLEFAVHPPESDVYIQNLSLRLEWGDNRQCLIGTASPDQGQPIRIVTTTNQLKLHFRIILSPFQLEAIEAQRNGGDFKFSVWLSGCFGSGANDTVFNERDEFSVKQQEWIEALDKMEYQRTFLYELPLPLGNATERVIELIQSAHRYLLHGDYDQCVGGCRKIFEASGLSPTGDEFVDAARKKYKGDRAVREAMDISERFQILRDALNHATQLAHHHHGGIGYSRDQAKAVLGATVAVLSCGTRSDLAKR